MKKINFIFVLVAAFCINAAAQSNPMDKKLEKARDMMRKEKYDDAEKYIDNLLDDNPSCGKCWDMLALVRQKLFEDSKKLDNILGGNIKITTKGADGKEVKSENDSLTKQLSEMLNKFKPSKIAYNKLLYTLRKGLLFSDESYQCSILLRAYLADIEVDTNVSKKALKYFADAEEEFGKKNYEKAAKSYQRAIDEQHNFYKASLYLGDAYYFSENYVAAISSFKDAVQKFPTLLEPRKYLVDAYLKERLYEKALMEGINAMTVYPDASMVERIDEAAFKNDKKLDIRWIPRPVFPNKIDRDTTKDINEYTDPKKIEAKAPWTYYQKALEKIESSCNDKGIITKLTPLTQSKYLEVYSWEEMLKHSNDPSLDDARKKQEAGYLDCYALVTCFHYDFYDQYLDFVTKNKDKVMDYYKKYLMSR
jgi:tetratricopeptide (TPR) repeat protein